VARRKKKKGKDCIPAPRAKRRLYLTCLRKGKEEEDTWRPNRLRRMQRGEGEEEDSPARKALEKKGATFFPLTDQGRKRGKEKER